MKVGILFSGGKDSTYAAYLAKKEGYDITCLLSIDSKNLESYMFHTPSIKKVKVQSNAMEIPLIIKKTNGKKELELDDLKSLLKKAKKKYNIDGVVTGAVQSVYQASRIQKICNELDLEVFNPLWQKDQEEILTELIKNKFKVIIVGVFAFPLNKNYLGKIIDKDFINELKKLERKWKINIAGEGGEYESFVIDCPMFNKKLKIKSFKDIVEGENNARREIELIKK